MKTHPSDEDGSKVLELLGLTDGCNLKNLSTNNTDAINAALMLLEERLARIEQYLYLVEDIQPTKLKLFGGTKN